MESTIMSTRLSAFQNPLALGTVRVGEANGTYSVRRNRVASRRGEGRGARGGA